MNEHMNPTFPQQRGCFIEVNEKTGKCSVVDYPTWTVKNGRWFPGANEPIPDGQDFEKPFENKEAALAWCKEENYVVCDYPKSDEEIAAIRAKREAYWAERKKHNEEVNDLDPFAELDI